MIETRDRQPIPAEPRHARREDSASCEIVCCGAEINQRRTAEVPSSAQLDRDLFLATQTSATPKRCGGCISKSIFKDVVFKNEGVHTLTLLTTVIQVNHPKNHLFTGKNLLICVSRGSNQKSVLGILHQAIVRDAWHAHEGGVVYTWPPPF